jgi:hypothetical protein
MYDLSECGAEAFDLVLGIQVRWPCLVTVMDVLPYDVPHTNVMSVCLYRIAVYVRMAIGIFVCDISIRL